jgi:hypothetical protein
VKRVYIIIFILIISAGYAFMPLQEKKPEEREPTVLERSYEMTHTAASRIMQKSCATSGCHRGEYPKAKLNLEMEEFYAATVGVPSVQKEKLKLVDTADPERSYLLMKIRGDEEMIKSRMPINAPPLKEDEEKTIRLWIHTLYIMNN